MISYLKNDKFIDLSHGKLGTDIITFGNIISSTSNSIKIASSDILLILKDDQFYIKTKYFKNYSKCLVLDINDNDNDNNNAFEWSVHYPNNNRLNTLLINNKDDSFSFSNY